MMTVLTRSGASALYQPQQASAGDRLAFLAPGAGATIALPDCWADRGSPRVAGYFVLMDRQATPTEAAAVETLLLNAPTGPQLPPRPKANGIVWLRLGNGKAPVAVAVATAELDASDVPIVSADAIIAEFPNQPRFGLGKAAPIAGTSSPDGDWLGLLVLSPPVAAIGLQPPSAPCDGPGIGIDLSLASAGQVSFRGLANDFGGSPAALKDLVDVLVDPVTPFNSSETFTGQSYALVEDSTGIHLRAAG